MYVFLAAAFFIENFNIFCAVLIFQENGETFLYSENKSDFRPENYMDRWILSFTQSLIKFVKQEMQGSDNSEYF